MKRRGTIELDKMRSVLSEAHRTKSYKKTHSRFGDFVHDKYGISREYGIMLATGRQRKERTDISPKLRWKIWERDNFTCHYCKCRQFLEVDHIVPISKGGTDDESNLVTSCKSCNCSKGKTTYAHFRTNAALGIIFKYIL